MFGNVRLHPVAPLPFTVGAEPARQAKAVDTQGRGKTIRLVSHGPDSAVAVPQKMHTAARCRVGVGAVRARAADYIVASKTQQKPWIRVVHHVSDGVPHKRRVTLADRTGASSVGTCVTGCAGAACYGGWQASPPSQFCLWGPV